MESLHSGKKLSKKYDDFCLRGPGMCWHDGGAPLFLVDNGKPSCLYGVASFRYFNAQERLDRLSHQESCQLSECFFTKFDKYERVINYYNKEILGLY
ncbi:uncharacterized protein LOC142350880 [Convolutriloba macropyga]|uniref:uncharacterized protein LOC142350880 n=1 Tax=Convolutriloba macropyga TaxID=536237 RepID=UPI003F51B836